MPHSLIKLLVRAAGFMSLGIIGLRAGEFIGFDAIQVSTDTLVVSVIGLILWIDSERRWNKG